MTVATRAPARANPDVDLPALPRVARVALLYVAALAGYTALMHSWQVQPVPGPVTTAGVLLAAVSLLPLTVWYARERPGMPMFELICLSYGIQYTLPLYLQSNSIVVVNTRTIYLSWDVTQQSLELVAAGLAAMIASYYGAGRLLVPHLPSLRLDLESDASWLYVVPAIAAGALNLLLSLIGFSPDPASLAGVLLRVASFQAYVALGLLTFQHYHDRRPDRFRALVLFASVLLLSVLGLATGLLENSISPFAIVFIVRWIATRRLPWRWLLVALLIFVTANSVKSEYRVQVWHSSGPVGIVDRTDTWLTLAEQRWEQLLALGPTATAQTFIAPTTRRLDLLHVFAWIYTVTPSHVAYFGGSTYNYFLYGWIPRFIFPDKPDSSTATRTFESEYALLLASQQGSASIGVGHPAEAFANFGWLGVIIVMALQGVFFAVLRTLFDDSKSHTSRAVYVAVLIAFLNGIGSYTAIIFTGAAENSLTSALVIKLVGAYHRGLSTRRHATRGTVNT